MTDLNNLKSWQADLVVILNGIHELNIKMKGLSKNEAGFINSRQKDTIQSLHRHWKNKMKPIETSLKTLYCLSERHEIDAKSISKICNVKESESSDALYLAGGQVQQAIELLQSPKTNPKTNQKTKQTQRKKKKGSDENVHINIERGESGKKGITTEKSVVLTMKDLIQHQEELDDSDSDSNWEPDDENDSEYSSDEEDEDEDEIDLDESSDGEDCDEDEEITLQIIEDDEEDASDMNVSSDDEDQYDGKSTDSSVIISKIKKKHSKTRKKKGMNKKVCIIDESDSADEAADEAADDETTSGKNTGSDMNESTPTNNENTSNAVETNDNQGDPTS